MKTHDNSRSLLMYIYEFCDEHYPKVLNVLTELKSILKISASSETDTLNKLYDKMKDNRKLLKDIITSDDIDETYDIDDRFIRVMKEFYKKSESSMKKLHMTVGNVLVSTKRLMKKFVFGSDDQAEPVEKLFQLLYQFLLDLETSKSKLVKLEADRAKKHKLKMKQRKKNEQQGRQAWNKYKGGTLSKALDSNLAFSEELNRAKGKLSSHIKNKSSFVAAGGDLSKIVNVDENTRRSSTMRRVSTMYQQDQIEARKLAQAREKARLEKHSGQRMRLPALPEKYKHTNTNVNTNMNMNMKNKPLPNDVAITAPRKFNRASPLATSRNSAPPIQTAKILATAKPLVNKNNKKGGASSPPMKALPMKAPGKKLPPNKQLPK